MWNNLGTVVRIHYRVHSIVASRRDFVDTTLESDSFASARLRPRIIGAGQRDSWLQYRIRGME